MAPTPLVQPYTAPGGLGSLNTTPQTDCGSVGYCFTENFNKVTFFFKIFIFIRVRGRRGDRERERESLVDSC